MIRVMAFTFVATLCVLYAPVVAIIAGAYILWRHYPKGA